MKNQIYAKSKMTNFNNKRKKVRQKSVGLKMQAISKIT